MAQRLVVTLEDAPSTPETPGGNGSPDLFKLDAALTMDETVVGYRFPSLDHPEAYENEALCYVVGPRAYLSGDIVFDGATLAGDAYGPVANALWGVSGSRPTFAWQQLGDGFGAAACNVGPGAWGMKIAWSSVPPATGAEGDLAYITFRAEYLLGDPAAAQAFAAAAQGA